MEIDLRPFGEDGLARAVDGQATHDEDRAGEYPILNHRCSMAEPGAVQGRAGPTETLLFEPDRP